MGIFNFRKKRKQTTMLDKFNEIMDTGSKDTNSALQFYKFAYITLPKILFENPERLIKDYYERGKTAVLVTYVENCMSMGGLPKRGDMENISIELLENKSAKLFIINFPELERNENNGLPVLTPISVAIAQQNNICRLFILGLNLFPGVNPTLREVDNKGANCNLGTASGKSNVSFLNDITGILNL